MKGWLKAAAAVTALVAMHWAMIAALEAAEPSAGVPSKDTLRISDSLPSETMMMITAPPSPQFITIYTKKGNLNISLQDGTVKADPGVVMDDAARQFWLAITRTFPFRPQPPAGKQP